MNVDELKLILEDVPDDYEVLMNIHHKYTIPKEDGIRGWIAEINGIHCDNDHMELRFMN